MRTVVHRHAFATLILAVALGAALAACSGGGTRALPPASATAASTAGSSAALTTPATFVFVIPAATVAGSSRTRSPQYIPSSVQSVQFSFLQVNGGVPSPAPTPTVFNVTPSSGCTGTGSYVCTFTVRMPFGSVLTKISAYSAASAGGVLLSQYAGLLAVVEGTNNAFGTSTAPLTLDANPGTVAVTGATNVSGTYPSFTMAGSGSSTFTLGIVDAAGAAFANPPPAGYPQFVSAAGGTGAATSIAGSTLTLTMGTAAATVVVNANPAATQDVTTSLGAAATAGATSLTVASATGIYPGANLVIDENTLSGSTLLQESAAVSAISGTTVTLAAALARSHASGAPVVHFADNLTPSNAVFAVATPAAHFTSLPAPPGGWKRPYGVAVDTSANVYVTDISSNYVVRLSGGGTGTPVSLPTPAGGFIGPAGIAVNTTNGNVALAANGSNQLFQIAGGTGTPTALSTTFNQPSGVAIDAAGNVYVADFTSVYKVPGGTGTPTAVPTPTGGWSQPQCLAVDASGNLYVADAGNSRVVKIPGGTGTPVVLAAPAGGWRLPIGVAVDGTGNLYVSDQTLNGVFSLAGGTGTPTALPTPPGGYKAPRGLAIDGSGNVYIANFSGPFVSKYTP